MKQVRTISGSKFRVAGEGAARKLVGLAIPYNSLSRNLGGFVERFIPGAVSHSVERGEIVALFNHDTSKPLASQKAGTLRLQDRPDGLHFEMDIPSGVSHADDLVRLMELHEGTGTSFGFNPTDTNWIKEAGQNVAEVRKADLGEISPLIGVQPAYAATSVALRSLAHGEMTPEDYGIDLDTVAGVFLAIKRGLPLSEVETEIMNKARALFTSVRRPLLDAAEMKAASVLL